VAIGAGSGILVEKEQLQLVLGKQAFNDDANQTSRFGRRKIRRSLGRC